MLFFIKGAIIEGIYTVFTNAYNPKISSNQKMLGFPQKCQLKIKLYLLTFWNWR